MYLEWWIRNISIKEDVNNVLMLIKNDNENSVKSRRNVDKLKELRGFVKFKKKEVLLEELFEKRKR